MRKPTHPLANQTVLVSFANAPNYQLPDPTGTYEFTVADWWLSMPGVTELTFLQNFATAYYGDRILGTPIESLDLTKSIYGKINGLGYIIHESEIVPSQ